MRKLAETELEEVVVLARVLLVGFLQAEPEVRY